MASFDNICGDTKTIMQVFNSENDFFCGENVFGDDNTSVILFFKLNRESTLNI